MEASKDFVKNGFIVKSYGEAYKNQLDNCHGIGTGFTWPLDVCTDRISRNLVEEAMERWFGYQDERLHVIPDVEYISRYIEHCRKLNISVICFLIESQNTIITTDVSLPIKNFWGYDYVDTDMCTSCLYDDTNQNDFYSSEHFGNTKKCLNMYGLLPSIDNMADYLCRREKYIEVIGNTEEYYNPTVVKVSEISLCGTVFARS